MPEMPTLNVLTPSWSTSILRAACSAAWNAGLVNDVPCTTVSMSFKGVMDGKQYALCTTPSSSLVSSQHCENICHVLHCLTHRFIVKEIAIYCWILYRYQSASRLREVIHGLKLMIEL